MQRRFPTLREWAWILRGTSESAQMKSSADGFRRNVAIPIKGAPTCMSMLGGKGTVIGPVIGAVLLYTAQELTWVNFPTAHLIAYGLFIIVVARFMPRGLIGFAIDRGWVRKGMVH